MGCAASTEPTARQQPKALSTGTADANAADEKTARQQLPKANADEKTARQQPEALNAADEKAAKQQLEALSTITADANTADEKIGLPLLHEAVLHGRVDDVRLLVSQGSENTADKAGRTAVWYALQHRDAVLRQSLREALSQHEEELRTRLLGELEKFAAGDVEAVPWGDEKGEAGNDSDARTTKKDTIAEEMGAGRDGRKILYVRGAVKRMPRLLDWLTGLPAVAPDLGYREEHIANMLKGLRYVVRRVARELAAGGELEDWMAAGDAFELLCAGYLFTTDCATVVWDEGDAEAVPVLKDYVQLRDAAILKNHGSTRDAQSLALYYTMNAAMRSVGFSEAVRGSNVACVYDLKPPPPQLHVIRTFEPLMAKLSRLIGSRRKSLQTVFRGIDVNVSAQYKVGTQVVWNAFTSTTLDQQVAKTFMYGQTGTFFVIVAKEGAADVAFTSLYPRERELLYDSNIEFKVQWKLSPTLLRMIGVPFDVIVMHEVTPGMSDDTTQAALTADTDEQVDALWEVLWQTSALFRDYLGTYVEGRVGDSSHVAQEAMRPLKDEVMGWLEGGRRPLCLVGEGGSGKTSAAIAVFCHLLEEGHKKRDSDGQRLFPIFVALPTLGVETLTRPRGVDEFIERSFGLKSDGLECLARRYHVVLILDSLDETGLTEDDLRRANEESGGRGLLGLHKWCSEQCSVIVTTRGEYLKSVGHVPSQVCGHHTLESHMQRFTEYDIGEYIAKVNKGAEGDGGKTLRAVSEAEAKMLMRLSNPFLLHMACYAITHSNGEDGKVEHRLTDVQVIEEFFQKYVAAELKGEGREERVEGVLRVGELLGCKMLEGRLWQWCLGEAVTWVCGQGVVGEEMAREALHALPLRVEDYGDDDSAFTFRHKTLGEYLVARRLAREGGAQATLGTLVKRCFSKDTPNVQQFFSDIVTGTSGEARDMKVNTDLLPLICATATEQPASQDLVNIGSNAMALAVRSDYIFATGLDGIRLHNSDLRGVSFSCASLCGARISDCWMEYASFHNTDLTGADFEGCDFGTPIPPMNGHTRPVTSVAYTPDGNHIVSGSEDGTIRVWDARSGAEVRSMKSKYVQQLGVAPDGETVVCSNLFIWDIRTGESVGRVDVGEAGAADYVRYSNDGERILVCMGDTLFITEVRTGAVVRKVAVRYAIRRVAVSADEQWVAGGDYANISLVETASGKAFDLRTDFDLKCVVFSPDSSAVAAGVKLSHGGNSIKTFDVATKQLLYVISVPDPEGIESISYSANGSRMLSSSSTGSVRVVDVESQSIILQFDGKIQASDSRGMTEARFSPDETKVVSANGSKIRVWSIAVKEAVRGWDGASKSTEIIDHLGVSPDASLMVRVTNQYTKGFNFVVYDLTGGRTRFVRSGSHTFDLRRRMKTLGHLRFAFTSDLRYVYMHTIVKGIEAWDLEATQENHVSSLFPIESKYRIQDHDTVLNSWVSPDGSSMMFTWTSWVDYVSLPTMTSTTHMTARCCLTAFAPRGNFLAILTENQEIMVYDLPRPAEPRLVATHAARVMNGRPQHLAFSRDGTKLAVVTDKNMFYFFASDVTTPPIAIDGPPPLPVKDNRPKIDAEPGLTFSNDVSEGTKLFYWQAINGAGLQTCDVHLASIQDTRHPEAEHVVFSPEGSSYVVLSSSGSRVALISSITGGLLASLEHCGYRVSAVCYSPNCQKILTGTTDGTVRVWDITTGCKLRVVCGPRDTLPVTMGCTGVGSVTPAVAMTLLGGEPAF